MNATPSSIFRGSSRLAVAGLLWGSAIAQDGFVLSDLTVSPSLTEMSGGGFAMESTALGDGAILATGGDFAMEAIVTPLTVSIVLGDLAVFLAVEGNNLVLTWPDRGADYVLEFTVALGSGSVWQPVQPVRTERRFVTPLAQSSVFFRLRRP